MTWTRYSTSPPTREGWYLVSYCKGGASYWLAWAYEALYWHPERAVWTNDARTPSDGGRIVERAIELWTEILCLERADEDD